MNIFENVKKEHVVKAINLLENNGLGEFPDSRYYDVLFEGKRYPPKPIMAIAYELANGTSITTKEFEGGQGTPAFKKLEELGFEIIPKNESMSEQIKKYWVEKTKVSGRQDRLSGDRALGKVLWSPRKDKRGADIYKNMRSVEEGDIILHLVDNKHISGVSIAKSSYQEGEGLQGTDWEGPAYIIPLDKYKSLHTPISRQLILNDKNFNQLERIAKKSEVFYTNNLELRQGAYLTPCPQELVSLIQTISQQTFNQELPYIEVNSLEELERFSVNELEKFIANAGLHFDRNLLVRFAASLMTKPFVILTGLSGSGKTKLAQSFVQWICQDKSQYVIVPVGADWTNREPLLGFPNALSEDKYIEPDSGVLSLIQIACENRELPYFLILDEMNLSHVERYFADFLSVMESQDKKGLLLYSGIQRTDSGGKIVPQNLSLPDNLFIIGTVNIDETTYMFSPKVLDRANTIEFRIKEKELEDFLKNNKELKEDKLISQGASMAVDFVKMSRGKERFQSEDINKKLVHFFTELKKAGAEFGYRSANEIHLLLAKLGMIEPNLDDKDKLDIAIMQKLLPKLHGSKRKLDKILPTLCELCLVDAEEKIINEYLAGERACDPNDPNILYPISLEKIQRMYQGAIDHGFASYAEA